MTRFARRLVIVLACLLAGPMLGMGTRARAQQVPTGIVVEPLATSLSAPTGFEFLPDGRLLFVEQFTGRVRLWSEDTGVQSNPVLSVTGVSAGGERGLLGIAVDPRYPSPPYLYLYYDVASPVSIRISRYTLSGNLGGSAGDLVASPTSRFDVVDGIPDNADNHNGGTIRFGRDGLLYASLGDDASSCSAQTPGFRGAILRLETRNLPAGAGRAFRAQVTPPDNPFASLPDSAARLVAAYGLRNPFRFQLDTGTGDLVIGDVGLSLREEVDILSPPGSSPAAGAPLGTDFGWPLREGTAAGPIAGCGGSPPAFVSPIWDYDRTAQADAAVISAGIYRSGSGQPRRLPDDHVGDLFANDYYSGVLYRLHRTAGVWAIAAPIAGQPNPAHWGEGFGQVSDWRVGPDGALWYCRQSANFVANTGSIGRVKSTSPLPVLPLTGEPRLALRVCVSPAFGTVPIAVSTPVEATLRIVDIAGRTVRRLPDATSRIGPSGERTLVWDGRDERGQAVGPGVYIASLAAGAHTLSERIVLIR